MIVEPLLALRIRSLRRDGRTVLRDLDLELRAGEIVGVAGHVGAGKSTLGLLAAGLLDPGFVLDGELRRRAENGQSHAGYVFANPWTQLTGWGGTVREEVAVGPENLGVHHPLLQARVAQALERTSTTPLAHRVPHELSGGELQRVALASALAMNARLLVLDEPASQLDADAVIELARMLRTLAAGGHGILLIEQNLELLGAVCDRLLVLGDGRPVATGDVALLDAWPPLDHRLGVRAEVSERFLASSPKSVPPVSVPLLAVRSLRAGYGSAPDVLRDVSLELPTGAIGAWIGANGVGKSTLARAIMGLVPARGGHVHVIGTSLDHMRVEDRARYVGLVFQDPGRQLFASSVLDEVMFGPRALGWARGRARESARHALHLVGLSASERAHPGDLTPQARRLVAIASAMASEPPLLVLDEPTAGQDAAGRAVLARALEEQRRRGAAAVITHDSAFARRTADIVHVFHADRIELSSPNRLPLPSVPRT